MIEIKNVSKWYGPVQVLNDENQPRMMEAIQAMWQRELGINVTIEPFEQKTLFQNQQNLAHTLGFLGWTADFPDPATFLEIFRTGNGQNWTGWGDKAYDALLDQATATADPVTRADIMEFDLDSISLDLDTPAAPAPVGDGMVDNASLETAPLADDPLATKLALAQEFNAIGDTDGARTLIEEVVAESSGALKTRAQRMLAELG